MVEHLEDRLAPAPLQVTSFESSRTGFTARFNQPLNSGVLNLYDTQAGTFGPADLSLVRNGTETIRGSLVVAPTGDNITFIRTDGLLDPGDYIASLRSASNAFIDLDGNRDGTPGDDYVSSPFTISAPAPTAVVVGVPDFARGPAQPVDVPATRSGIPLSLSNGDRVRSVTLIALYDPRLLSITAATVATGMPAGAAVVADTTTSGQMVLTFTSPTDLPAGPVQLLQLTAHIPDTAPYGSSHILNLSNIQVQLNGGTIVEAPDDDGLHVVAYLGDATANRQYSSTDAQRILRVALGLDSGFAAYPLTDATVIGEITGNSQLGSADAIRVMQESVGIDVPEIASLPGSILPRVTIAATDANASEPGTNRGTFTVTRTGFTTAPLTVTFTIGGTATNGVDYATIASQVTIPAGLHSTTITVAPIDDPQVEGNETVVLTLSSTASYTIGTPASATITIFDNETPTITVNASTLYQRLSPGAWEGTLPSPLDPELEPYYAPVQNEVIRVLVDDIGINRVRLEMRSGSEHYRDFFAEYIQGQITSPMYWENIYAEWNDNADPFSIDWGGFYFTELDAAVSQIIQPMRQRLQARGEQLYVNLNYVDFNIVGPNTVSSTPYLHMQNPEEYAELIEAAFRYMQQQFGFVPDAVEVVLEPDNAGWSGTRLGQAIVAAGQRLQNAGFGIVPFVAPSDANIVWAIADFDLLIQVPGVRTYLSEMSYHRYSNPTDSQLQAIASRGAQYNIKTAMLEHIGSGQDQLHADLTKANVSAWQQYAAFWPSNGDTGTVYARIDMSTGQPRVVIEDKAKYLRQYFRYIRGSAQRIGATTANSTFDPVAFINTNGTYVVVVKASGGGSFSVAGLPAGTYGITYTVAGQNNVARPDVTLGAGQVLSTSIPAAGVLTIFQVAANRLSDPGFESSGLGWQGTTGSGRSIVTSPTHSGSRALQMVVSSQLIREVFQEVAVTAGATYDAAGWIRTTGVGGSGSSIQLLWLDAAGNVLRTDDVGTLIGTNDWTRFWGRYAAPTNAVRVRFRLFTSLDPDNVGTSWFDDLELRQWS